MANLHRIIDTQYGEVCIKEVEGENYCEAYIGDNYDDYLCDVDCSVYDTDEVILEEFYSAYNN